MAAVAVSITMSLIAVVGYFYFTNQDRKEEEKRKMTQH